MRKYDAELEQSIRTERLVREWTRSGLIEASQRDRMLSGLQIDVRRTNVYLRLVLFGFTIVIIAASILFVAYTTHIRDSGAAVLCLIGAAVCFGLAEYVTGSHRTYRFGIEEAAAVAGTILMAIAVLVLTEPSSTLGWSRHVSQAAALVVAALSGFYAYGRFGHVHSALIAMLLVAAVPFQFDASAVVQRIFAAVILGGFFLLFRLLRRKADDAFPGDEYRAIQAGAWVGSYLMLNLYLTPGFRLVFGVPVVSTFYWFTYVMIWLLPFLGLYLAVQDKDRIFLDVNLALALATLMTNKPYLHGVQQTWDPILFGLLLIGVAVGVRRWLLHGVDGVRNGFTASRLLSSDKRKLSVLGTASAALQGGVVQHSTPSTPETYHSGGGKSGGAGASGGF